MLCRPDENWTASRSQIAEKMNSYISIRGLDHYGRLFNGPLLASYCCYYKERLFEVWGADWVKCNKYLQEVDRLIAGIRSRETTGRLISQNEVSFSVENFIGNSIEDLVENSDSAEKLGGEFS